MGVDKCISIFYGYYIEQLPDSITRSVWEENQDTLLSLYRNSDRVADYVIGYPIFIHTCVEDTAGHDEIAMLSQRILDKCQDNKKKMLKKFPDMKLEKLKLHYEFINM